jgi:hypothetical protein
LHVYGELSIACLESAPRILELVSQGGQIAALLNPFSASLPQRVDAKGNENAGEDREPLENRMAPRTPDR